MQNTEGISETVDKQTEMSSGFWATALDLGRRCGPGVFFVGIQPKLLRAGVNHAVTFATYNQLLQMLDSPPI